MISLCPAPAFQPLLKTMRPRQWVKNGLLFIPLIFDKQLTNWPALASRRAGFRPVLFALQPRLHYQ